MNISIGAKWYRIVGSQSFVCELAFRACIYIFLAFIDISFCLYVAKIGSFSLSKVYSVMKLNCTVWLRVNYNSSAGENKGKFRAGNTCTGEKPEIRG